MQFLVPDKLLISSEDWTDDIVGMHLSEACRESGWVNIRVHTDGELDILSADSKVIMVTGLACSESWKQSFEDRSLSLCDKSAIF